MKKILVTGGSSGLGAEITKILSKDYMVFYTYCNNSKGQQNELHLDLKNPKSIANVKNWIEENRPEILINNAIAELEPLQSHKETYQKLHLSFSNNISSVIDISNTWLKFARKSKGGKMINILSSYIDGNAPIGMSRYTAEKQYLMSFVRSWAQEHSKFGIAINAISPSTMKTDLTSHIDERIIEQLINSNPQKRLITTTEVAEVVAFLCQSSSFLTGQNIVMNAGQTL